jgi:hypothetical protein
VDSFNKPQMVDEYGAVGGMKIGISPANVPFKGEI